MGEDQRNENMPETSLVCPNEDHTKLQNVDQNIQYIPLKVAFDSVLKFKCPKDIPASSRKGNMPRNYKRKTDRVSWTSATLQEALTAIENGRAVREVSRSFAIPRATQDRRRNGKVRKLGPNIVAQLFNKAFGRVATVEKVTKGFEVTGIFPVNRDVFTAEDFAPPQTQVRQFLEMNRGLAAILEKGLTVQEAIDIAFGEDDEINGCIEAFI
ncbi:hypothetical protein JTB14_022420 [Gonioctena quinquepunctata]|nr:hypothetical protein JTB14_022420 [Gonioctena quinquepunctata]